MEPYCSREPRTSAVYGSTNTARVCSGSIPSTPASSTRVVAPGSGEGRTALSSPSGWAARAAAIWSRSGSSRSPSGTRNSSAYTIFSAWKEAAYNSPENAATSRKGAMNTPA